MPYTTHVLCSYCKYKTPSNPTLQAAFERAEQHERTHHRCATCGWAPDGRKNWESRLGQHEAQCKE